MNTIVFYNVSAVFLWRPLFGVCFGPSVGFVKKAHSGNATILFFFLFCLSSAWSEKYQPVNAGTAEIETSLLEKNVIRLDGEWEFHHMRFPQQIAPESTAQSAVYATVPKSWNGMQVAGREIGGAGYATYRLKLRLSGAPRRLALRMGEQGTAVQVFVNGTPVAARGITGMTAEQTRPDTRPLVVYLGELSGPITLDIAIANFHYRKGGMWNPVEIGDADSIVEKQNRLRYAEIFVAGALFVMAIYHFVLFTFFRAGTSAFIFAWLCIVLSLRLLTTGQRTLPEMFPVIPYAVYSRIEYASWFFSIPVSVHYVHSLFGNIHRKWLLVIAYSTACIFSLSLVLPSKWYSYTVLPSNLILFPIAVYALIRLFFLWPDKPRGIRLFSFGAAILVLFTVNDILYIHEIFRFAMLGPFGMLAFVLCQALVLSGRFLAVSREKEALQQRLNESLAASIRHKATELNQARRQSAESLQQFRNAVDNIPGIVYRCSLDAPHAMIYLSDEVERLTGYAAAEFCSPTAIQFQDIVCTEYREERARKLSGVSVAEPRYRTTYRLCGRNGAEIWVEDRGTLVADSSGKALHLDGVMIDITLRKSIEDAMGEALERAEQASIAKSRFLANMSHELRTPLHGVIGMVSILNETTLDAEQRELLSVIESSGNGLLTIINQILDIAKIESGTVTLESNMVNIRQLVGDLVTLLSSTAQDKGLTIANEFATNVPEWLKTDGSKLRQVLLNLLGNAIKFTEQGEIRIDISWQGTVSNAGRLEIALTDTGIGMTDAQLAKIFDPFVQGDSSTSRRFGGTGLGLTISRELVRLLGGNISVTSTAGKGSRFHLSLPVLGAEKPEDLLTDAAKQSERPMRSLQVLLAEDDDVSREICSRILKELGHEVTYAHNGAEAAELFRQVRPDIVFMDCMMPQMDGFEATRRIRMTESELALARTPIIALTANAMRTDLERCYGAGIDEVLAKPFRQSDLAVIVRKWGSGEPLSVT